MKIWFYIIGFIVALTCAVGYWAFTSFDWYWAALITAAPATVIVALLALIISNLHFQ